MHRSHRFLLAPLVLVLALFVGACSDDGDDNPVIPPATLELNSGTMASTGATETYVHTFTTAGTYPYHCNFHSNMQATVIVDPASTVSVLAISITDFAFSPTPTTVDTGAVVTWTNNGAQNHPVTSN
jgi:plastocyanin